MQTTEATSHHAVSNVMDAPTDALLLAYNAAFSELGLRFRWDAGALDRLGERQDEQIRMADFIKRYHPHLFKSYDAEFLSALICQRKNAYLRQSGLQEAEPRLGLVDQRSH